ncbi:hypothetical protein B0A48_06414 [Cryoendolithus antarcticus]|uniref:Multicopper oxidase n=1 Tax=Cryoendolithus antarcticus TaxID=1507870 RepID=A0A1V8TB90_9PEZI|nr:hypothetical protein B0A48_06414 [Cryoendolithus antarcticus]
MSAHPVEPREHEKLEDDWSATTSSSLAEEQEQGLLGGWKELGDTAVDGSPRARRTARGKLAAFSVCTGIILLLLSLGDLVFLIRSHPRSGPITGAGITSNDYILDPEWDQSAPAQRREYTWIIRDHIHNPDGIYRPMILVNNQFPGPIIEVNESDTIVVHVENRAVNATSIHWHGMYQNGTNHMDGTTGVTQCPIAPGQDFTYEFTVSGQSGSYWWHGHVGVQTSDGLHGPLIIHGRNEKALQKMPYDTDRVILLSDHYHDLSSALLWQYLMPDMENAEPVPVGALINGKGVRDCSDFPDRKCDNMAATVGMPRIKLDRNKSHRLRIINVGAFAEFQFQIDEHEMAVTEVDGTDVHPVSYHRLNINPAQRYSVVISSDVTSSDAFWMRARMITTCFTDAPKTMQADALAVVAYEDAKVSDPTSKDWEERLEQECRDMNTTDLVPVEAMVAPSEPDAAFYLRSNFEIGAYRLSRGFFNQSSWRPSADSPTLHRAIDGLGTGNETFQAVDEGNHTNDGRAFVNDQAFDDKRELVIQTTGTQVVDLLVSNFDDGNHPLHLHGYKYFVLAQGHGYPLLTHVGAAIDKASLAPLYETLDLSNPLRRDTASVEAFGWILLRVVMDNPGTWAFHCHVSWHAEAGLLMQFLTRSEELATATIPQANLDLCNAQKIMRGMGPDDSVYKEFAK